jgi:Na+-driven multidrug efflux pump
VKHACRCCALSPSLSLTSSATLHHVQFAGTQQLAALGPASVIFNFSSYVFNALGIATTTVVSHHVAKQDLNQANDSATTALLFGLVSGAVMLALLQVSSLSFCCTACARKLQRACP